MTFPVLSANGPSGYNLTNSLRFRASASAYLNRTPASAGNRQTWTWSGWVKRGRLGSPSSPLFSATAGSGQNDQFNFNISDAFQFNLYNGSTAQANIITTQVFRDPSAWYHIVIAVDTAQATASNRVLVYVNGSQVTSFSTASYPSLNYESTLNAANAHRIGNYAVGSGDYFDGYLTDVNFIDGQALTPSSFGETDVITGVWQPAKYTGTYGTNGFYLPFTNTTSTTTLGNDFSGNGNNWTTNNISLTPGATYDAMTDVPTLTSPTAANYCVMNPIQNDNGNITFSEGNLKLVHSNSTSQLARGTIGVSTGKWYFEFTVGATGTSGFGVIDTLNSGSSITTGVWYYSSGAGFSYLSGTGFITYGATFTTGDVIGVALNCDTGTLEFYKNNVSQGVFTSSLGTRTLAPAFTRAGGTSPDAFANFGQRPFAYTPPSGFVALNTFNLPSSTIPAGNKYMDATLYTGTGSSLSVTNSGSMQPDWVWIKSRSAATDHALYDVLRGTQARLESNTTDAEVTSDSGVTAFGTGGFTVGTLAQVNTSAATYVGWQWKANGAGVTNTAGSITSTVSANTTSGFSVATFTMPVSGVSTVGHGLGVAPSLMILKGRSISTGWAVYHVSTGNGGYTVLNTTGAFATDANAWNNTSPTSSVFTIGTTFNNLGTYVAYCFAPIAGFSAFGSYTGNGSSDGPFIYTGFRPRFVMVKNTTNNGNWLVWDSSRSAYNAANIYLLPNTTAIDQTSGADIDILSNGFKIKNTTTSGNGSGDTLIYAAFAENPFRNALAR